MVGATLLTVLLLSPAPVDLAVGPMSCLADAAGAVWCWGRGVGPEPQPVEGVAGAVQVEVTSGRGCARLADGRVLCWAPGAKVGEVSGLPAAVEIALSPDRMYALGADGLVRVTGRPLGRKKGPISNKSETFALPGLRDAVQLEAGGGRLMEGCARRRDGAVLCWAPERSRGHGWGTERLDETPTLVAGLGRAVSLAVGEGFGCAGLDDGSVRCWGANDRGQLGDGSLTDRAAAAPVAGLRGATGLAAGGSFACASRGASPAACWGFSEPSLFGDASPPRVESAPRALLAPPPRLLGLSHFHACGVSASGALACWGDDDDGALGGRVLAPPGPPSATPAPASDLPAATSLTAAGDTTCAAFTDGTARCWGSHRFGQIGDGTRVESRLCPTPVHGLDEVAEVALGESHACARRRDGTVRCWGANYTSELGQGAESDIAPLPVPVAGLPGVTALALGNTSCALLADATVRCWGGLDGDDSEAEKARRRRPSPVPGLRDVRQIAAGGSYACAVLRSGRVRCWGRRWAVGRGLEALRDVVSLSARAGACALHRDGRVTCWGQYGPPLTPERPDGADLRTPARAPAFDGVASLALGPERACGLRPDGRVLCQADQETAPAEVAGLSDVVEVALGRAHTCARTKSGELFCWGENGDGQLGAGTTTPSEAPRRVRGCAPP